MKLVLRNKEDIPRIKAWLDNQKVNQSSASGLLPFDADKYNGIMKIEDDAKDLQKRLRDEWN